MIPLDEWTEAELLEFAGMVGGERAMERERFMRGAEPAWKTEPPFKLEDVDLLALTGDEIVFFSFLLRDALRDMRELLHVAVAELAGAHRKLGQRHNDDGRSLLQEASASTPDRVRSRAADEQNVSR